MNRTIVPGIVFLVVAAACGSPQADDAAGSRATTLVTTTLVTTTTCAPGAATCGSEGAVPTDPEAIVPTPVPLDPPAVPNPLKTARTDLALRLGVPMDHIEVVSIEEVVWRNGNLGCDTGEPAIQVLTDGYQIVLQVHEVQYYYHGKTDLDPVFCATPDEPLPPGDA